MLINQKQNKNPDDVWQDVYIPMTANDLLQWFKNDVNLKNCKNKKNNF